MNDDSIAAPRPDAICDGGDLDCGSGLLLIVGRALVPLPAGGILELRSREPHVLDELPIWCEAQGHTIVDVRMTSGPTCYLIRKGAHPPASDPSVHPVVVRRRGGTWSADPAAGVDTSPLAAFLAGLGACISEAARTSDVGRARGIDHLEVSLVAGEGTKASGLSISGEIVVPMALEAAESDALRDAALEGSRLARSLATPPTLSVRSARA